MFQEKEKKMTTIYKKVSSPFAVTLTLDGETYLTTIMIKDIDGNAVAIAAKETETQKEAKRFLLGTVNTLRNSLRNLGCDVARTI